MFRSRAKLSRRGAAALIIAGAVAIMGVLAYSLSKITLIDLMMPAVGAFVIGAISALFLWKKWQRLTRSRNRVLNAACQAVCCSVALTALFFLCNFVFADKGNAWDEKVAIVEKHASTRHRSRRVGRARYVQGEAYQVYDIDVRFNNGFVKELSVSAQDYRRYRVGDSICVTVARGAFGVPVVVRH